MSRGDLSLTAADGKHMVLHKHKIEIVSPHLEGRSTSMSFNKGEMIEQLKFEIEMIEKGRYYPSVREYYPSDREPLPNPEIFRDTITCLNVGLSEKRYPCLSCFLSEFVPPELRNCEGEICHKIQLNEKGDTIESLKAADDPYRLEETVLGWLKNTVTRLEQEVKASK
jgi:hypothetical protein